ncbi:MAG: response regulator [Bacteroidales bacterium]|nr:response regulator [Bacteroidales bacterium]
MVTLLLVSNNRNFISSVSEYSEKAEIFRANSGNEALDMIANKTINLVISDESLGDMTGLEFAEKLISLNPMVDCAVVSSLSSKDYHEASEGLGLMMQLPVQPEKRHLEQLLLQVNKIIQMTSSSSRLS